MVSEPKPNSLSDISCQITLINVHIICLQISVVDTLLYLIHAPHRGLDGILHWLLLNLIFGYVNVLLRWTGSLDWN